MSQALEQSPRPNSVIAGHQKVVDELLEFARGKGLTKHQGIGSHSGVYDENTRSAIKEAQRLLGYKDTGKLASEEMRILYNRSYKVEGGLVEPKSPPSNSPYFGHRELVRQEQALLNKFLAEEQKSKRLMDVKPIEENGILEEKTLQLTQAFRKANGFDPQKMRGGFSEFNDKSLDLLKEKYGAGQKTAPSSVSSPIVQKVDVANTPPAETDKRLAVGVGEKPNIIGAIKMLSHALTSEGSNNANAAQNPVEAPQKTVASAAPRIDPKANPDGSGKEVPPAPAEPQAQKITSTPLADFEVAEAINDIRAAVKGRTSEADKLRIVGHLSDAERNKKIDDQMRAESSKGRGLADYLTGEGVIGGTFKGDSAKFIKEVIEKGYQPERFRDILLGKVEEYRGNGNISKMVLAATPENELEKLKGSVAEAQKAQLQVAAVPPANAEKKEEDAGEKAAEIADEKPMYEKRGPGIAGRAINEIRDAVGDIKEGISDLNLPGVKHVGQFMDKAGIKPGDILEAAIDFAPIPGGKIATRATLGALGGLARHVGMTGDKSTEGSAAPKFEVIDSREAVRESIGGIDGVKEYAAKYTKQEAEKTFFPESVVKLVDSLVAQKAQHNGISNPAEYAKEYKDTNPSYYNELEALCKFRYDKSFEEVI